MHVAWRRQGREEASNTSCMMSSSSVSVSAQADRDQATQIPHVFVAAVSYALTSAPLSILFFCLSDRIGLLLSLF